MTTADLETLAHEHVAVFNRSDWEAVRAMMAPEYVYEETGTGRRTVGPDESIAALQGWKSSFPDATGEIRRVAVVGDSTAAEIVWVGTHSGPLATPAGPVPASGRRVEVWATMWVQWRDGLMVAERHHLDVLTLLASIGAIPAPTPA